MISLIWNSGNKQMAKKKKKRQTKKQTLNYRELRTIMVTRGKVGWQMGEIGEGDQSSLTMMSTE